ncbi:MAG: hypothetical protein Q3962_07005 [Corynebacterium sp.]|nr:hypothetical protein [Corynebacterium sp.]
MRTLTRGIGAGLLSASLIFSHIHPAAFADSVNSENSAGSGTASGETLSKDKARAAINAMARLSVGSAHKALADIDAATTSEELEKILDGATAEVLRSLRLEANEKLAQATHLSTALAHSYGSEINTADAETLSHISARIASMDAVLAGGDAAAATEAPSSAEREGAYLTSVDLPFISDSRDAEYQESVKKATTQGEIGVAVHELLAESKATVADKISEFGLDEDALQSLQYYLDAARDAKGIQDVYDVALRTTQQNQIDAFLNLDAKRKMELKDHITEAEKNSMPNEANAKIQELLDEAAKENSDAFSKAFNHATSVRDAANAARNASTYRFISARHQQVFEESLDELTKVIEAATKDGAINVISAAQLRDAAARVRDNGDALYDDQYSYKRLIPVAIIIFALGWAMSEAAHFLIAHLPIPTVNPRDFIQFI